MSFDLVDSEQRVADGLRPVTDPTPGAFDNFLAGTARFTMKGFAEGGRMVSMAAAAPLISAERFSEGTEIQDRYFKFHDEVFGNAVDAWTPKPSETGVAAEIAGSLLSTLPLAIASPAFAVAKTQLSTAEDLVRKGVPAGKAQAVGAVQGASLGLGIWMPMMGSNLWQRALVGGAGFNVAQGIVTRGVSGSILDGTPGAGDFKAFDWPSITLDTLLGLAFGGMAHLSPAQRKQGQGAWERIHAWVSNAKPSDIDALAALRQAEHLNVESAPGKLGTPADVDAHVTRMRAALDQLAQDKPVSVDDLPAPKVQADPARLAEGERIVAAMQKEAAALAKSLDLQTEKPPAPPAGSEPPPPRGEGGEAPAAPKPAGAEPGAEPKPVDPVAMEAERFAAENPDVKITVGTDESGEPIRRSAKEYLAETQKLVAEAEADAKLFEVAASCMLGVS